MGLGDTMNFNLFKVCESIFLLCLRNWIPLSIMIPFWICISGCIASATIIQDSTPIITGIGLGLFFGTILSIIPFSLVTMGELWRE